MGRGMNREFEQIRTVGLDFGTTNTLLTILSPDGSTKLFECSFGDRGIVPSVVGPRKTGGGFFSRWFGLKALEEADDFDLQELKLKEQFKLGLPRSGDYAKVRRKNEDYISTRDFLQGMFDELKQKEKVENVDRICMAVPQSWINGDEQLGIEAMLQLASELQLPSPEIVSEPVCAASYFLDKWNRSSDAPFEGHILVYDHGGGTLDLSLVKVEGGVLHHIDGEGLSTQHTNKGLGGVAFDWFMFDYYKERGSFRDKMNANRRRKWLRDFEHKKRRNGPMISEGYKALDKGLTPEASIFTVNSKPFKTPVAVEDINAVFTNEYEKRIAPAMIHFLNKYRQSIDLSNPNTFRVLTVGGFSEFLPVQRMVSSVLKTNFGVPDKAFLKELDGSERWEATSRGAALIAAEKIKVEVRCPFTIGIVTYDEADHPEYDEYIMQQGEDQSQYASVKWHPVPFEIGQLKPEEEPSLKFFIMHPDGPRVVECVKPLSQLLPAYSYDNKWEFGCRIDRKGVHLLIKDKKTSTVKPLRFGAFFRIMESLDEGAIELN